MELKKSGKSKKLSNNEMKAKLSVLEDLRDMAAAAMGDSLKGGLHSAKIVSDSPEGLKKGAEMLEKKLEESDEMEDSEGEEMEEGESEEPEMESESIEGEVKDYSALSPEDLEKEIEKLLKIKEQLKAKSFGIK